MFIQLSNILILFISIDYFPGFPPFPFIFLNVPLLPSLISPTQARFSSLNHLHSLPLQSTLIPQIQLPFFCLLPSLAHIRALTPMMLPLCLQFQCFFVFPRFQDRLLLYFLLTLSSGHDSGLHTCFFGVGACKIGCSS